MGKGQDDATNTKVKNPLHHDVFDEEDGEEDAPQERPKFGQHEFTILHLW